MYIFKTGLIGKAVHQKVENAVNRTEDGKTFADILRSLMGNTKEKTKTVGYINNTESKIQKTSSLNGKTLLYAMSNTDTDTTASAVLNNLGLYGGSDSDLKTAADSLSASASLLSKISGSGDTAVNQISEFVERYNGLLTALSSASTSSGYLYSSVLKTAADTASEELSKAGITISDVGKLSFDAGKLDTLDLEDFLTSIAAACTSVSAYSSSVSGNSLLGLYSESAASNSTSSYLSSLMDLYV